MKKKEALTSFHQEAIAEAADRLFLRKGFKATAMDEIAKEAGYSKATLYVYFESKDQIRHYILLKAFRLLYERLQAGLAESQDALEQYWAICREYQAYSEQHPNHAKGLSETIATDESSRNGDPLLQSIYEVGEQINDLIQTMADSGVKQGYFKADLPAVSTGLLYGAMLSGAIELANNKEAYIRQRTGISKDDFLKFGFETMLRGLLREGVEIDHEDD